MLDNDEAAKVAQRFGVAFEQVRRDHLISHLLAALGARLSDRVVLFGGTALARTHWPDGRLSEDIDLLSVGPRGDVLAVAERVLAGAAARQYGRLRWEPPLTGRRGAEPGVLRGPDQLIVRVQLLNATDYPQWPTELRDLLQRYSDAPPARLRVPTPAAFAAWKTVAWADRNSPRDLYDLWGLASRQAMTPAAARLYARLGPTGQPPPDWLFDQVPSEPPASRACTGAGAAAARSGNRAAPGLR